MTDNQLQSSFKTAVAATAAETLKRGKSQLALIHAEVIVSLTNDTFLRSLNKHVDPVHDYGTAEIHKVIRDLSLALNHASSRLETINKRAAQ